MKTLYIVRHAKSSWEYEGIKDIDRPLNKRGINDAYLISNVLHKKIATPDVFVASCANRALHTGMIFSYTFNYPLVNLKLSKSLYNFSDGYLIKTVKALDDGFDSAIIFSHDHGISDFVNKFGSTRLNKVPTCAVIGIKFNTNHWKDIKNGNTFLTEFPKHYK
ncbi:MAG: histidine phosphatase family protein [Bacteroidetes bacterium]|jgi:phosphohistidine phosphatase|nr:histidine phosphatase family protein [Bacteroidota bacterium]